jgi:uncharacterized protein YukE
MINPDVTRMFNLATRLRQISDDMHQLNNTKLQGAADNISTVWRGEAANRFLGHNAQTRSQIRLCADELLNIANLIEFEARVLMELNI